MKHKFSTTLRPNSAKLVHSSTLTAESRRHSIGSFIAKEKNRTGSVSDQVPAMPAPKPPAYNSHTVGARLKNHFKMGEYSKFIILSMMICTLTLCTLILIMQSCNNYTYKIVQYYYVESWYVRANVIFSVSLLSIHHNAHSFLYKFIPILIN